MLSVIFAQDFWPFYPPKVHMRGCVLKLTFRALALRLSRYRLCVVYTQKKWSYTIVEHA